MVERCPHCNVASPAWKFVCDGHPTHQKIGEFRFEVKACTTCNRPVTELQIWVPGSTGRGLELMSVDQFPRPKALDLPLPEMALNFLEQAIGSLHAPDGAMMLAASSIDAMLKDKGYPDGSLHSRINQAKDDGKLIPELAEWAHEVRLDANAVRHADTQFTKTTLEDANQAVEFARMLGELWYGLPGRIEAKRASNNGGNM